MDIWHRRQEMTFPTGNETKSCNTELNTEGTSKCCLKLYRQTYSQMIFSLNGFVKQNWEEKNQPTNDTPRGMKNANGPKTRVPNSTATAFECTISYGVKTIKYEKFMKTYKAVMIGTDIRIERGIFLKRKYINSNEKSVLNKYLRSLSIWCQSCMKFLYLEGFFTSSVTIVTAVQPSYAHNPLKKANAIFPALDVVPSNPVLKFFVFPVHSS